tara:strand:+ start:259 stop:777 length:519 start_codon:yes stop_codon:yes gene_type:complete
MLTTCSCLIAQNDGCTSGEMRDRVFLDRLSTSLGWIGRGDVVVLRSPDDDALITKRIVGLAGDRVRRRNSVSQFVVPRGHVWIEGDNDEVSMDSTHFGAVATEAVEAKVACKLWPLSEVGVVRSRVHDSSAARVSREVEAEAHEPAAAWRGPKLSVSATMRSFVSQTDGRVL